MITGIFKEKLKITAIKAMNIKDNKEIKETHRL